MNIITRHLPAACHSRRKFERVGGCVIHFISDKYRHPRDPYNPEHIFDLLSELLLSYHVLIARDGTVYEFTDPSTIAWHAGYSRLGGRERCNKWTHGVALAGAQGVGYSEAQVAALAEWLAHDMSENRYTFDRIAGHDEVREAWNNEHPEKQAGQKMDPGPLFPWDELQTMLRGVNDAIIQGV